MRLALPIDSILPRLGETLRASNCLVLQASPGSGKTTRVPPFLLAQPWRKPEQEIVVLEPRRLAAKLSAFRVAEEEGEPIGKRIGYRFRMESQGGPQTKLWFLTEGMLMRRLLSDRQLSKVGAVVLDEFHERHLHTDLALAYLLHLQRTTRPDLKLIVMSATLDAEKIAKHLGGCPIITVESRLHPITTEYLEQTTDKYLDQLVKDGVRRSLSRPGDMLVFLPGMAEIRRAETALRPLPDLEVFALHGDLSREEQQAALGPSQRRKVILATNIAETSLTLPGITTVIDSGLHRQAAHSWWSGVPTLKTKKISKASAEQRAGRAGRVAAGHCVRLYPKFDLDTRPAFDLPELQRADLAQTLLELLTLDIVDFATLPWLEPPPVAAVQAAMQLLSALGAVEDGKLTKTGRRMAEIPAHPRLARMLIEAEARGVLQDGATLAALISEGELDQIDALSATAPPWIEKTKRLLLNNFENQPRRSDREALARSVLAGFPDRVARRRTSASLRVKQHETEVILASGGSAIVESSTEAEWYVALDAQEKQKRLVVRSLVPIEQDWIWELEPSPLEEKMEVRWENEKVRGMRVLRLGQLVLEEKEMPPTGDEATRLLLRQGFGIDPDKVASLTLNDWIAALRPVIDPERLEQFLARLSHLMPPEAIAQSIVDSMKGATSLKELKERDWFSLFPDSHKLAALLPEKITLPSGRQATIHYRLGKPPWVESKLQDFCGMVQGPSVMGGKLPLTLHLLAPNKRAVQVTSDLAGFWDRAYPAIRKELSRKYPRHPWPEDPRAKLPLPAPRSPRGRS